MKKLTTEEFLAFTKETFDKAFGNEKWSLANDVDDMGNYNKQPIDYKDISRHGYPTGRFLLKTTNDDYNLALAYITFARFPSACGIVISYNLNSSLDDKVYEAFVKWHIEYAKIMGYGMLVYSYTENQSKIANSFKKQSFKEVVKFTSPRTNNVCKIATLDLTK